MLELWEAQEGEQWLALEYLYHDRRFEVVHIYPEEIDPKEMLRSAVRVRFIGVLGRGRVFVPFGYP